MFGSTVAMRFYSRYLRLEQGDALSQFILRIRGKILAREPARGVSFGTRAIFIIHDIGEHRNYARLLSMRMLGICSDERRARGTPIRD